MKEFDTIILNPRLFFFFLCFLKRSVLNKEELLELRPDDTIYYIYNTNQYIIKTLVSGAKATNMP